MFIQALRIPVLVLVVVSATYAATLPEGFTETAISGLSNPTAMQIAPDGRIFVCQQGGAIAGGAFYNPVTVQFPPSFAGKYFFADLCGGWIRWFDPTTGTASDFATDASFPVDLKVGTDGSLYYLSRGAGALFRVQFVEPFLDS